MAVINLTKDQRVFLLNSVAKGELDTEEAEQIGIRRQSKYDSMTDDELKDELVRLAFIENDDPKLVERCCKKRHSTGCGCYLAMYFCECGDTDTEERIKAAMRS